MRDTGQKKWMRLSIFTAAAIVVGCFFLIRVFSGYHKKIYNQALDDTLKQIDQTSDRIANEVSRELKHAIYLLKDIEQVINTDVEVEMTTEQVDAYLESVVRDEAFRKIGLAHFEQYLPKGRNLKITQDDLSEKIENGSYYISNIHKDDYHDREEIFMAVPLYDGKTIVGAVWGRYSLSAMTQELNLDKDTTKRYFAVIDAQGRFLSQSSTSFVFEENRTFFGNAKEFGLTKEQQDEIRLNMKQEKTGNFWIEKDGRQRYIHYSPIGVNGWYIVSGLTEEELLQYVDDMENTSSELLLSFGIFMIGVVAVITVIYVTTYRDIKEKNRELQLKDEVFSIIQREQHSVTFAHDRETNQLLIYNENFPKYHNKWTRFDSFSASRMVELDRIHPEDSEKYERAYKMIDDNQQYGPVEIEMRMTDRWGWRRISSWKTKAGNIVGFIEDFDEQKHTKAFAQRDGLTGLYNRRGFEQEVEPFIGHAEAESINALFYLDLDHFKEINDQFGHAVGDELLCDVAHTLESCVRTTDLVCRRGGDEFVLFLKNVRDEEAVEYIAQKLIKELHRIYVKDGREIHVTASIGVAIETAQMDLAKLCETADEALYEVKRKGRNGYKIANKV